jgi:hypothetical protein
MPIHYSPVFSFLCFRPLPSRAVPNFFSNLQCQCSSLTTFFFEHSSSGYCGHNIIAAQFEKQSAVLQFLFYFMKGAPWLQWRPVTNDMHAPLVWYGDDGVSQLALVFLHLVFFTCSSGSPAECIADSAVDCEL